NVQPGQSARFAIPLTRLLDSAKSENGQPPGFLGRKTALNAFFNRHFQMCADLFVELLIELFFVEEIAETIGCLAKEISHLAPPSPSIARTRPMTPASRCQ